MAFYTNHTRHHAIVTISIQATVDSKKTLKKGTDDVEADVGYHDFIVEPGASLILAENTTAILVGVRGS